MNTNGHELRREQLTLRGSSCSSWMKNLIESRSTRSTNEHEDLPPFFSFVVALFDLG